MAKSKSSSLARIVKSLEVRLDGEVVHVPVGKEENRIASMVSAAQLRELIQSQMKKYKDGDLQLSPKDMRDLSEALHTLAKFSGEVYAAGEAIGGEDTEKPKEPVPVAATTFEEVVEIKP